MLHVIITSTTNKKELRYRALCEIWGFHGTEDSSWGLLGCDVM